MSRSSPRALSSPRARSRRRRNTSGDREGSWTGRMRNAEFGMRNRRPTVQFRIPHSAFRIASAVATAPATVTNSRRRIVLAPPDSAAYITRPPRRLEGGFPMPFEARIEPLTGKLPKVSYRWDPETDIRVGRQRAATVVRVADLLLVEVDKNSRLAGLWFLDVPPFPNVEATA